MIKIKICGITQFEDATAACDFGATALGFVFFQQSKRYVSPLIAEAIVQKVPVFISKIGVFVNEDYNKVTDIAQQTGLTGIQLHGDEDVDYCYNLKKQCHLPIIKAFRVKSLESLEPVKEYVDVSSAFLLDNHSEKKYGGTGTTFNWELANTIKDLGIPLILAGGINDQNIWDAIRIVNPYAIDVSTSLEAEPGIKDHQKLQELFRVVSI